jgi:hypothetical protein
MRLGDESHTLSMFKGIFLKAFKGIKGTFEKAFKGRKFF